MAYILRSTYHHKPSSARDFRFFFFKSFISYCLEHDFKCKHVKYHLGAPPVDVNATIIAALTLTAVRTFEKKQTIIVLLFGKIQRR